MSAEIVDRGRGPEIGQTRVTVYRIMDFLQEGSTAERIARELTLTDAQVEAALAYIAAHRELVDEYERILTRVQQSNPDWVEAGKAGSVEELRRRIRARHSAEILHAGSAGQ